MNKAQLTAETFGWEAEGTWWEGSVGRKAEKKYKVHFSHQDEANWQKQDLKNANKSHKQTRRKLSLSLQKKKTWHSHMREESEQDGDTLGSDLPKLATQAANHISLA